MVLVLVFCLPALSAVITPDDFRKKSCIDIFLLLSFIIRKNIFK